MVSFLNWTSYKNVYSALPGTKFVSKQQKWKTSTQLGPAAFQKKAQKNKQNSRRTGRKDKSESSSEVGLDQEDTISSAFLGSQNSWKM